VAGKEEDQRMWGGGQPGSQGEKSEEGAGPCVKQSQFKEPVTNNRKRVVTSRGHRTTEKGRPGSGYKRGHRVKGGKNCSGSQDKCDQRKEGGRKVITVAAGKKRVKLLLARKGGKGRGGAFRGDEGKKNGPKPLCRKTNVMKNPLKFKVGGKHERTGRS